MNEYTIEQKISTMAQISFVTEDVTQSDFSMDSMDFSQSPKISEGFKENYWICRMTLTANSCKEAHQNFVNKFNRIISRISFVGQCAIQTWNQPFIIKKTGCLFGYLNFKEITEGTGLQFGENEKEILQQLLDDGNVPDEFYYYWNDAVNSTNYSSKLLNMFAAIDALTKRKRGQRENTLGEDLNSDLYQPNKGLRHRLIHGEYFSSPDFDSDSNHIDKIHNALMHHFNKDILSNQKKIRDVKNPQRNYTVTSQGTFFIQRKDNQKLDFEAALRDFNDNNHNSLQHHKIMTEQGLFESF
jgi:hypothetical protein